jgi:segregation and condensation protein B
MSDESHLDNQGPAAGSEGSGDAGSPPLQQAADEAEAAGGAVERKALKRILEALLFSSDRPVTAARLAELSGASDGREVRSAVQELQQEYEAGARAFGVEEIAGGFQLLTKAEFAPWVSRLHASQEQDTLSKAALETLAIVAYRQPVTRAEVEDIRGVQSGHLLRSLVERRLLKVVGRSDELGRALLYGTTRQFLQAFGLRALKDLPKRAEFALPQRPQQGAQPQQ